MNYSHKKKIMFFLISMTVIIGTYIFSLDIVKEIRDRNHAKETPVSTDWNLLYDFETIEKNNGKIVFSGWALRLESKNVGIGVLLEPSDGSEPIVALADTFARDDVIKCLKQETDVGECGFEVAIEENQLSREVCYELQLILQYRDDTSNYEVQHRRTATNQYLFDGTLYSYNPIDFEEPKLADETLSEVIRNGKLCVYSMEKRVWFYLYNDKIYCIADVENWVPLEQVPSVPIAFYTLYPELVPEARQAQYMERGFDSIETYLQESNYYEGLDAIYGITVTEVPDYPVTYVRVGTHAYNGGGYLFRGTFLMDMSTK